MIPATHMIESMIELTDEQQQTLSGLPAPPLRVLNPSTKERFVLLPEAQYERMLTQLEDVQFAEEMAPLIWETMKDDWAGMTEYAKRPSAISPTR